MLLANEGGRFRDLSHRAGIVGWSTPFTGFGVGLFDQDHDGAFDLYVTNGGVNLTPERIGKPDPYSEPDHFARHVDGRFVDATAGSGALVEGTGRAAALGDLDADGDLDLVVTNNGGALRVLANQRAPADDWLIVDVRTAAGAPALGARVELRAGGVLQRRTVRAGASYLASHDPRAHFGLGSAKSIDEVKVRWPDGRERSFAGVAPGRVLVARPSE